ncbi:MAG: outer membrane protein assembly factor [Acidobacteriota bacterium]
MNKVTAAKPCWRCRVHGLSAAFGCALILAAAPVLAAQQDTSQQRAPQGQIVEAIEVEGNARINDSTVLFYISTRVGAAFDWVTAEQDFRSLLNTDFFDNLSMRWRPGTNGVIITIEVVERPMLRRVRIEGTKKVSHDDLIERMKKLEMPIEEDSPIDNQRLRRAKEVLVTMLQGEEGFQFVRVDLSVVASAEGAGVDALYSVVEGDEVRIENVYFDGATVFSQRQLRYMMKRTGEHWMLSFITKNDRFSWNGFENDMLGLMNIYRGLGYLDFVWDEPKIEVYDVDRPIFFGHAQRLYITIPIVEGPKYKVGEIKVEGNTFFTDEQLVALVPLQTGDIVDVKQIIDAREAMQTMYQISGYQQVQIGPVDDQDAANGVADITFMVNENPLYYVHHIDFEGNTNTRDYVIRRNLRIHEKDRWNQSLYNTSLFKIQQLGYFDNVEPELTVLDAEGNPVTPPAEGEGAEPAAAEENKQPPDGSSEPEKGQLDVKVKLREVGRNQISFGGGASALEGGFIQLGYTTRNLFGRGQTASVSGQFGGRSTNLRLGYSDPFFLNRRLRFGADFFRSSLDFFDFASQSTGISTRIGFPLDKNEFTTLFVEYNFEFIKVDEIGSTFNNLNSLNFNSLFLFGGNRRTSSIRPFITFNSIDNPFNPSRGRRTIGSFELAGGLLGGTLDFWKAQVTNTIYIPTVKTGRGVRTRVSQLVAINTEFRYGDSYGSLDQLPIFERFFLGGSQSIRGTRIRAVGPLDEFGNIIGGNKSLQYNLEYILQVADPLRVAIFHDAGQAYAPGESIDFGSLRKTAGVEFRIFAPVFNVPFRFFWAFNFDPLTQFGEERSTFEFAIGTTF